MSSHKGSLVAQGNRAPAGNRAADTVELVELGARVEKTGKRAIRTQPKLKRSRHTQGLRRRGRRCGPLQAPHAMEKEEELVHEVCEGCWRAIPYDALRTG
ncbi:hypothetical protein CapIbe_000853 [Capra ibex]